MTERIELRIGPAEAGQRLDAFVAGHPGVGSRTKAQELIAAGAVTADGRTRPKSHLLEEGEAVVVTIEPPIEAGEPADPSAPHEVIYEDEHLMVVDKPAGVVVHPAPGHRSGTLVEALQGRGAGGSEPWRPGIVHRLDRDTSGLLVVAKDDATHRALQDMLRRREIERRYLALVEGRPDARSGTIEASIGRDRRDRTSHSTRTDRPRAAVTHFEIERRLPRTTLLRVRLETGRTHQIRVHMSAIGHPVCGDGQYGGDSCGARLGLTRQFLHSESLRFTHPITGANLACESKLPVDLLRALEVAAREPVSEGPDGG
ncbi:MAG TPA: RluA family pseudouridine synthase [Thermoleophilaceae bacterium]|nr:RluA family pseudouridine synthase [Thermoleophilaceae bacterium]